MKKIFISLFAYDNGKSGISAYINEILLHLPSDYHIYALALEEDKKLFPQRECITYSYVSSSFLKKPLVNMLWHLFVLPFWKIVRHCDYILLPAANRRLFAWYPKKTIAICHDLSQFHIAGKYDIFRMFYIKKIVPFFLKKADHIIAISQSTANDMHTFFHIPPEKITVNYSGIDHHIYNTTISNSCSYNDLGLPSRYILYTARIEHPGKNHLHLIKAYEQLNHAVKEQFALVLTGAQWSGAEVVMEYWMNSPDKESIFFTGFIPKEAMPSLYRNASLYVFPSYFEGFGFPLVEAMACGVPSICSNCGALPEIGGEAVKLFNPSSIQDIKEKMEEVLLNPSVGSCMIEKGIKEAEKFSWNKNIALLCESFNKEDNHEYDTSRNTTI